MFQILESRQASPACMLTCANSTFHMPHLMKDVDIKTAPQRRPGSGRPHNIPPPSCGGSPQPTLPGARAGRWVCKLGHTERAKGEPPLVQIDCQFASEKMNMEISAEQVVTAGPMVIANPLWKARQSLLQSARKASSATWQRSSMGLLAACGRCKTRSRNLGGKNNGGVAPVDRRCSAYES